MQVNNVSLSRLSDEDLVAEVKRLARCERETSAWLVAHLAELDARRLYAPAGFPSLFAYCTAVLRLSEGGAYNRINAARLSRRFPVVLEMLQDGRLNLATLRLVGTHLDAGNWDELLSAASGRSRREVEVLLAQRFPEPPVPTTIRKLPEVKIPVTVIAPPPVPPTPAQAMSAPPVFVPSVLRSAVVAPLNEAQYRVTFTAKAETYRKLKLAQDLLRHQVQDGSPADIIDRALSALLENLCRKKLGASQRPRPSRSSRPGSRHVPAQVKRAVWLRDGGCCAFVATDGRRCGERGFLEFHHVVPYAVGGRAVTSNIGLRCRAHNAYEADLSFGPRDSSRDEISSAPWAGAPGRFRASPCGGRGPGG